MNSEISFKPAGVILAGGRSSRLGPGPKAMTLLGGQPMIRHVIPRMQAQTSPVLLSVQDRDSELDEPGLVNVPDIVQRHRGPLTGLCSAMQYLLETGGHEWLLLCPCDAPFLPLNLADRLYEEAIRTQKTISTVRYKRVLQPTFSLWNLSVFPQVHDAVMTAGQGGLMSMLDELPHAVVNWQEKPLPAFFNVNTKADLIIAARQLDANNTAG